MAFIKAAPRLLPGRAAGFLLACFLSISALGQGDIQGQPPQLPTSQHLVQPGVVLERFDSEFDGPKKLGMEPGDVLLGWSRGSARGRLESPFDLSLVLEEEGPEGEITLQGLRGTEKKTWLTSGRYWGSIMRPNFSGRYLAAYMEGAKLAQTGKPLEAAERWRALAGEARQSNFAWLSPWIHYRCGETLADAQQWKEADTAYQDAVQQSADLAPAFKADLLRSWGWTFYRRSEWDQARKYLEWSLAESRKAGTDYLSANDINRLAFVARGSGDLAEAEKLFREKLEVLGKRNPHSLFIASSFLNLGMVLHEMGELAKSEEYLDKALTIYLKEAPNTNGEAYIRTDLAETMLQRGDLVRAEKQLRKAVTIEERVEPDTLEYASVLNSLADVLDLQGSSQQAEEYLRKSLRLKEKVAPGSPQEAGARESLGDFAMRRGDLEAADQAYREALAIQEKVAPQGIGAAQALSRMGDVSAKRGDLSLAETYHRRALAIREKLIPGSTSHAKSLAALAGIMRQQGQLDPAASYYAQAIAALESQTARLGGSSEERAGYRSRHSSFYLDYMDLLASQGDVERAFDTLERWRGRTLVEMLAGAHVDIDRGVDPTLLDRERALRVEVKAKSQRRINLMGKKNSAEQLNALEKEISDLTAEYQNVEGQIRYRSPAYSALVQPQPLNAKEIQQLLDKDTLLLEYSLGEEHSRLFAVTPGSLKVFELPKRSEIEKAAVAVYRLLIERRHSVDGESLAQEQRRWANAETAYSPAVAELSRVLLAPVGTQIRGKRLLIVADGSLHYVPFTILPEPAIHGSAPVPLVVNHEVINLPSASVLALLREQYKIRQPAPKAVAVLADPVFAKEDPRVTLAETAGGSVTSGLNPDQSESAEDMAADSLAAGLLVRSAADVGLNRNGRVELPRLRYSRQEAEAILSVTPPGSGLKAVDFQANRATAIGPELSQYRIVHFATHGLLNSEHPELSGLVLSLVDKNGKPQEGFLELPDIYNLKLQADLVVLSACETGLGKEISGEGLIGMTRGFMYAGASRVVASLWNVSDVATAELMAEFYRAMEKDHLAPGAALRAAQVHMLKQKRWRSPYYWAAFQIQGEWK